MDDLDRSWADPWLLPGEKIVWSGRPSAVRRPKVDLLMAAYLGVGAPVILGVMVVQFLRHTEVAFGALVLAIAALGMGQCAVMLYGLLVRKPRAVRDRRYALTDRRLLIGSARSDLPGESWYRDQLTAPRLRRRPDGTADIRLSRPSPRIKGRRSDLYSRAGRLDAAMVSGIADPESFVAALTAPVAAIFGPAMPQHASDMAVPYLGGWIPGPGEQVLWSGRPTHVPWWFGSAERSQALGSAVFPLFVAAMGAVAEVYGAPPVFLVPCAALFVAGCYVSFGRVFWRRARIRRSTYVVTDQRVICRWDLRGPRTTEAFHRSLLPPQIRPDGSVFFRQSGNAPARANGWPLMMHPAALGEPPNFIGLADPKAVASIVAQARAAIVTGAFHGW